MADVDPFGRQLTGGGRLVAREAIGRGLLRHRLDRQVRQATFALELSINDVNTGDEVWTTIREPHGSHQLVVSPDVGRRLLGEQRYHARVERLDIFIFLEGLAPRKGRLGERIVSINCRATGDAAIGLERDRPDRPIGSFIRRASGIEREVVRRHRPQQLSRHVGGMRSQIEFAGCSVDMLECRPNELGMVRDLEHDVDAEQRGLDGTRRLGFVDLDPVGALLPEHGHQRIRDQIVFELGWIVDDLPGRLDLDRAVGDVGINCRVAKRGNDVELFRSNQARKDWINRNRIEDRIAVGIDYGRTIGLIDPAIEDWNRLLGRANLQEHHILAVHLGLGLFQEQRIERLIALQKRRAVWATGGGVKKTLPGALVESALAHLVVHRTARERSLCRDPVGAGGATGRLWFGHLSPQRNSW